MKACFLIAECSLSSAKIVQKGRIGKSFYLFCYLCLLIMQNLLMANIHWAPLLRLISEHPVASVFTMTVCLAVVVLGVLFCIGVFGHK